MTTAAAASSSSSSLLLGRNHPQETELEFDLELELVVKPTEEEVVVVVETETETEAETEEDEDEKEKDALLVAVQRISGASACASSGGNQQQQEVPSSQAKTTTTKTERRRKTTRRSNPPVFMVGVISIILAVITTTALMTMTTSSNNNNHNNAAVDSSNSSPKPSPPSSSIIRVAHIGNSIQYYNDCPRLLEHLLQARFENVYQNSCLRGGATLVSLLEKGNGMKTKFSTRPNVSRLIDGSYDIGAPTVEDLLLHDNQYPKRKTTTTSSSTPTTTTQSSSSSPSSPPSFLFDFVVMNDHTQSPARFKTRQQTIEVLKSQYVPLIQQMAVPSAASASASASRQQQQQQQQQQQSTRIPTIIFIQTAAYKSPGVKNSGDLGTFDEFTTKLQEGYQEYVDAVVSTSSSSTQPSSSPITIHAKIAPVGTAYQYIRQQQQQQQTTKMYDLLWSKLYARDDFHPSPLGTYLQACVLYCTITDEPPPAHYDVKWWDTARYMQPLTDKDEETTGEDIAVEPLPLPTPEEAKILRDVACRVCGIGVHTHGGESRL